MSSTSTREKLLSIVDDMELICRELLENLIAPKHKRLGAQEHQELSELLIAKDEELKAGLELAREQAEIEEEISDVRAEVDRKDESIRQLQKQLKEAENLLATSIYQAKQKLKAIDRAKDTPVSSEDLIKYAHRISASNAVCAPLNWQQGDPRRPYPTDVEMRQGFLGRSEAAAVAMDRAHVANFRPTMQQQQQQQAAAAAAAAAATPSSSSQQATPTHQGEFHNPSPFSGGAAAHHSPSKAMQQQQQQQQQQQGFAWQHAGGGEMGMMVKDGMTADGSAAAKDGGQHQQQQQQQDVEVMSTDSSSSSSTDSNG